ncbi:hypothetical protein ACJX0J_018132, partial [Zea mays]
MTAILAAMFRSVDQMTRKSFKLVMKTHASKIQTCFMYRVVSVRYISNIIIDYMWTIHLYYISTFTNMGEYISFFLKKYYRKIYNVYKMTNIIFLYALHLISLGF